MHRPAVFQDRHVRDIMAENSELKKFHEQMKRDVRSILMRHEGVQNRVVSEYTAGVNKRPGVGRARSSRTVESGVTVSLKKQWNSLKQLVESLETRVVQADDGHVIRVTDHEKELTKLRKELEELKEELEASRELIGQQQLLLQEQLLPPPGEAQPSPLWDAYFLEEQLRLQQDRATFEEQKRAFKDERDKFTEAAIRLGRERLQFKADQALFIKQQFLNMTPGLGTPPWKRTPPWSSFNADTPPGTHHNPKVNCTPRLHGPSNSHKKVAAKNPMTPSTAELYRVLRLAPPSNSSLVSQRREKRSRKEGLESEDNNRSNDSLSSRSESPEPEVLPHSALPLRMSMTPYLRPRPTPMSVPRGMKTPCTTELYRKLRLCSTDSASCGRRCDSVVRTPVIYSSCTRGRTCEGTEPMAYQESVKKSLRSSGCSQERDGASYDTDSLHENDRTKEIIGERESPSSEERLSPRNGSECFERDSLLFCEDRNPSLRRDTLCFTEGAGESRHYVTDQGESITVWPREEMGSLHTRGNNVTRLNEEFHPRESDLNQLREDLYPGAADMIQANEDLHPDAGNRSWLRSNHSMKDSCRSMSREALHLGDRYRRQSREGLHPKDSRRSKSRESLHPQVNCRSRWKESNHSRESLYTSRPRQSPRRLGCSCSSAQEGGPWTSSNPPSHFCADLLNELLEGSF